MDIITRIEFESEDDVIDIRTDVDLEIISMSFTNDGFEMDDICLKFTIEDFDAFRKKLGDIYFEFNRKLEAKSKDA